MLDLLKLGGSAQTYAFLFLLGGKGTEFHFRTLDDKSRGCASPLIKKFFGRFADLEPELRELNERGAGVFGVINADGDLDANISHIRAVFVDTDGAPLEPILEVLKPHLVIETSPGKYHVYWLVGPDFPVGEFKRVQRHLAQLFRCDRSVCNLARIMRLPGFLHQKSQPFNARIIHLNAKLKRYCHAEIIEAFGIFPDTPSPPLLAKPQPVRSSLLRSLRSNPHSLTDVEEMLRFIDPWDRQTWRDVIFALVHEYGEDSRDLAVRWSRGDLLNGRGLT